MNTVENARRAARMLGIAALALATLAGCKSGSNNGGGGQGQPKACQEVDTIGKDNGCFAATVLSQGSPFPNPVAVGHAQSMSMKIGAVNAQFAVVNATITTKAYNTLGQSLGQQNMGSVSPNSNFQNVPVWTANVAPGLYSLQVTVDLGVCGVKTICVSNRSDVLN